MAIDSILRGLALQTNDAADPGVTPELAYGFTNTAGQTWMLGRMTATEQGSFGGRLVIETNAGGGAPGNTTIARLTINQSGQVGIGTISPGQALDVAGQGLFRSAPWTGAVPGVAGTVIGFDPSNAGGTGFLWSHTTAGASTRLWLDGDPIIFAPAGAERMRIDSGGNVGIGTMTPTTATGGRALHVHNPSGPSALRLGHGGANGQQWEWQSTVIDNTGAMNLSNLTSMNNPVTVLANGNVGIGSTAPRRRLDVLGEIVATNRLTLASGNAIRTWHLDNDGDRLCIFDQPNINTRGTERLSIDQAGNVSMHSTGFSTLTVGAGANGAIKVRHINGKHWQNDTDEGIYLNWGTGQPVHVGGGGTASDLMVEGTLRLPAGGQLYAPGRLHIHGEEILYLLNKGGVIVSKAWGGNGNLMVEGSLRVQSENNPLIITGYTNDDAARHILDNSPIYSLMIAVEERPQGTALVFYWKDGDGRRRKAWDQGIVL